MLIAISVVTGYRTVNGRGNDLNRDLSVSSNDRESNGETTAKLGFSVVAAIRSDSRSSG